MHRWDTGVQDSDYLTTKRRDTKDNQEKRSAFVNMHLPLLNIEIDHIISDELQLLLRITDMLLKNLIVTAVTNDKRTMGTR